MESETTPNHDVTVRKLAYEYVFYLLAHWYTQKQKTGQSELLSDFEQPNDLPTSKLLLLPFFFATANGHTKALVELMGPFCAQPEGAVPQNLQDWVRKNPDDDPEARFTFFIPDRQTFNQLGEMTQYGLAIRSGTGLTTWQGLREAILNQEVGGKPFREHTVPADEDSSETELPVWEALDKSVDIIRAIDPNFIVRRLGEFSQFYQNYRSYRFAFQYVPNRFMDAVIVRNDRKMFSPRQEVSGSVSMAY